MKWLQACDYFCHVNRGDYLKSICKIISQHTSLKVFKDSPSMSVLLLKIDFWSAITITPSSAKCCVHFWVITETCISQYTTSSMYRDYWWSNHDSVCRNSRCSQLKCDFDTKIWAHVVESTNFRFFFSFYHLFSSFPYIIIMVLIGVNIITAENRSGGVLPLSGHNE